MEGEIIQPFFDNVLVKKDNSEQQSKTGIVLNQEENPALIAEVISVGKDIENELKAGDKIMYDSLSGRTFGEFLMLSEHDILGKIKNKECVHSFIKMTDGTFRCENCYVTTRKFY